LIVERDFFGQEVRKMSAPDRRALVDRGHSGECHEFWVASSVKGEFGFRASRTSRAERSNPLAAQRRAAGAGLDGDGTSQAIIGVAVMRLVIALFLQTLALTIGTTGSRSAVLKPESESREGRSRSRLTAIRASPVFEAARGLC